MKFVDFRKYFFSYIYIILAFTGMYLIWLSSTFPPPTEDEFFSEGTPFFMLGGLLIFAYYWCCGLLIIEILLRKFAFPKIFPNFKFSCKINIPKKLNCFLSVLFYILFAVATLPLIITLWAFVSTLLSS